MSNITITIADATPEEAQRIFDALRGETTSAPATQKTPPKTASVKKEEKAEEPAPEAEDEKANDATPSEDDVINAAKAYVGANSREALIEKLSDFGVKNISALKEDQRQKFIDSLS